MRTYVDVLMEIYKIKHESASPERKIKIKLLKIVLKSYELALEYKKSKEKIGYKNDFLKGEDIMSFFGATGIEENENKIKYLRMKLKEIKTRDKTFKDTIEVPNNYPAEAE